jgi:hypothetical protein
MKNIKKLIGGVISCVLAASLLSSIVSGAAVADDFTVKISSETVQPGENYTLTLNMENIPSNGLNVCEFGISYDPSLVTVENVELGSLADEVTSGGEMPDPFAYMINTGVIDVLFSDISGTILSGSGTFLSITGKVNSAAADGSEAVFEIVPIGRAVSPGSDKTNEKVIFGHIADDVTEYSPALESGTLSIRKVQTTTPVTTTATSCVTTFTTTSVSTTVTQLTTSMKTQPVTTTATTYYTASTTIKPNTTTSVSTTAIPVTTTKSVTTEETPTTTTSENDKIAGDVNLDGRVTVADVIMLQKYFVKAVKFSDLQYGTADFNEDGIVNIFDVIGLKRFLLYSE